MSLRESIQKSERVCHSLKTKMNVNSLFSKRLHCTEHKWYIWSHATLILRVLSSALDNIVYYNIVVLTMESEKNKIDVAEPAILSFLNPFILFPCQTLCLHYPQCNSISFT